MCLFVLTGLLQYLAQLGLTATHRGKAQMIQMSGPILASGLALAVN